MAELRVKDIKNREVVYGCAFNIDFDRNSWYGGQVVHIICKPIKGIINKWNEQDDYPNGHGRKLGKIRKITNPKTETSIRIIPLSESVLFWIDELERRQIELGIDSEFLFTNRKGLNFVGAVV